MRVSVLVVAAIAASIAVVGAALGPRDAQASRAACGTGAHGAHGYAYAGYQASTVGHGVRAVVSATRTPMLGAGHVAGWIGVGGPGQGRGGETMWLQTGVVNIAGSDLVAYAEITRPGRAPRLLRLAQDVVPGQPVRLAVLEMSGRPNTWRVWLNGKPVTDPVVLPGSTGLWRPIATAESYTERTGACNAFGFRFEAVSIATRKGGAWQSFVPGFTFLDRGFRLRALRTISTGQRTLALEQPRQPRPYAFVAGSS